MKLARYAVLGAFAALAAGCAISTRQELDIGRQYADQLARGAAGEVATQASGVAARLVLARYSRDQEREADRSAVEYTTAAGINPDGIVDFFRILRQVEGSRPSEIESFFASHPLTEDRIREVSALIASSPAALAATRTGRRDGPEFARLKAAVERLPPPADRRQPARQ